MEKYLVLIIIFYLLTPSQSKQKAEEISQVHIKAKLQNGGKLLTKLIKEMAQDLSWTAQAKGGPNSPQGNRRLSWIGPPYHHPIHADPSNGRAAYSY